MKNRKTYICKISGNKNLQNLINELDQKCIIQTTAQMKNMVTVKNETNSSDF